MVIVGGKRKKRTNKKPGGANTNTSQSIFGEPKIIDHPRRKSVRRSSMLSMASSSPSQDSPLPSMQKNTRPTQATTKASPGNKTNKASKKKAAAASPLARPSIPDEDHLLAGIRPRVAVKRGTKKSVKTNLKSSTKRSPATKASPRARGSDQKAFVPSPAKTSTPHKKSISATPARNSPTRSRRFADNGNNFTSISTPSATSNTKSSSMAPPKNLIELEENFGKLKLLRMTEAESIFHEYREMAEERFEAESRLIEALREENEALRARLQEGQEGEHLRRMSSISTASTGSNIAGQANSNNASSLMMLELYEGLCGLCIEEDESVNPDGKSPEDRQLFQWKCSLSGRLGEFSFTLSLCMRRAEYTYTPTFSKTSQMASRLPAYLGEEIIFDPDQLQLFFWRALDHLMKSTQN